MVHQLDCRVQAKWIWICVFRIPAPVQSSPVQFLYDVGDQVPPLKFFNLFEVVLQRFWEAANIECFLEHHLESLQLSCSWIKIKGGLKGLVCLKGATHFGCSWKSKNQNILAYKLVRRALFGIIINFENIVIYDQVSDLGYNWVAQRPDIKNGLKVVKMVLNT